MNRGEGDRRGKGEKGREGEVGRRRDSRSVIGEQKGKEEDEDWGKRNGKEEK
jgi:hypothetical protein